MKKLGLIGGMSWQSTLHYYRLLNEGAQKKFGGLHSANLVLRSVDFANIEALQRSGDWNHLGQLLNQEAQAIERAGAEVILLCTNTMHKVSDIMMQGLSIPLLHITDALGEALRGQDITKVGILGTRFTMEEHFYSDRLKSGFGIDSVIPNQADRQAIDAIIFSELCYGVTSESSRQRYCETIINLKKQGAQAVALACTELGLLVNENSSPLPVFDTTRIHVNAALDL